jgi:tRNA A-37 threonylcarbamoyl transferase component Bud32
MLSHVLRKVSLVSGWVTPFLRTTPLRVGRFQWHVTPAGARLFGDDGPDLDGWIRDGLATVVKQGTQRTVFKVTWPHGSAYVKRCRVDGLRAWCRELLRPAKARLEFENAVALRELGLPAIEPLAWASVARRGPGQSVFITRCESGAIPLQSFLDDELPKQPAHVAVPLRRSMSIELGNLMARLHDAGVAHPDPHPGNLLVTRSARRLRFVLIDLHAIRFGRPLSWCESLQNLVLFNRWFQLRAQRTDRLRFWQAYVKHRTTLPTACPLALAKMAAELERRTIRSNAAFWLNRFPRYRKCGRHMHCLDRPGLRGIAVRDLPAKFVERLAADPAAPFRESLHVHKDSPSATIVDVVIPMPDGPRLAVFKHYKSKAWWSPLKNLLRPTPALRSWLHGHNLVDRHLPTARPLCLLEARRFGLTGDGWMLAEKVAPGLPLVEAVLSVRHRPDSRRVLRLWADVLGRTIREMHDKRVAHRDLKASNLLMRFDPQSPENVQPVVIDLVGLWPMRGSVSRRFRARDLARLTVSLLAARAATRTDLLRVLQAYMAWGLHGRQGWKEWWRTIEAAVGQKQARNRRKGRLLS